MRNPVTRVRDALRNQLGIIVRRALIVGRKRAGAGAKRWQRAGDALAAAIDLPAAERAAWLDRLGAADPPLRREMESLLAAHARPGLLDDRATDLAPLRAHDRMRVAGDTMVAHYRVLEWVGAGAMGVVYKAWDQRLDRTVVLKFLPQYLVGAPTARERFRVEAQAAAALDHPNICTIYEVGESDDGQVFIAMPYYEGGTLARWLERGPLPVGEAVAIGLQTAHGLTKAHERGIVHRDIKPENLAITTDGVVKILDFGIAKLGGATVTEPGAALGTLAYMSPEQTWGEPVDARADLWSLGIVLYQMLAGALPYAGADVHSMLAAIRTAEPEALTGLRVDVPPALVRLVRALLAKRAEERPASASDVAAELAAIGAVVSLPATSALRSPTVRDRADAPLLTPAGGERRQAAVVALRISGHADLLEAEGSAYAGREMALLRSLVETVITRHGGVVNRFDDDAAIILFGIPKTREDDSLRAARAATELIARRGETRAHSPNGQPGGLRLHAGLDVGGLVARSVTEEPPRLVVSGATVDLASRLAGLAPAGCIWVSPRCGRLLEPWVRLEPQEAMALPGGSRPMAPYAIVGAFDVRTRLEAAERQRGLTPYTGRDRELAVVRDALADACRGAGRFVTVAGDAGMGKSRLLHEIRQLIEEQDVLVLQGRCPSYGGGAPYLPFIEVLREGFSLTAARSAAERVALVEDHVHEGAPELGEFVPLYLHLLSVPSDERRVPAHMHGEQFRLAAQEAIAGFLTASSRHRPTVLLLEDWHWVDDASHAVLSLVADLVSDHALLVLVTSRPGYVADWGAATPHAAIALGPLAASSSRALLRAMLRVDDVPLALATLLHERTGGNPFFLEEICHALLEDGTLRVAGGCVEVMDSLEARVLPDTVQAVIRARLDRLDQDARNVLRLASVIGREFGRDVLEQTTGDPERLPAALGALKSAGLIQQMRILPAAEYRFKHVLTQEVAYASLLEHQRRAVHGRVGEAIEALADPLPDEWLERLAYHFGHAEQWDKAEGYAVRAADRAALLAEFQGALELLERARGWLGKIIEGDGRRERVVEILLRQERLSETLGLRERQQRLINEMIALLEPDGDPARLAEVYVRQGDLHTLLREFGEAEGALERSLRLRRELGDALGTTNSLRSLGLLRWHEGRDAEALVYVEEALAIDRERGDTMAVVGDLSNLGYVLKGLGLQERARSRLLEGLELCDRTLAENPDVAATSELALKQSYLMHNLANVLRQIGDDAGAFELLRRTTDHAAGKRMPIQLSYHYTSIAHLHLQAGRIDECLEHYRAAVNLTRQANFVPGLSQSLSILGNVLLGMDREAEALPHLEEAAKLFAQLKNRENEARLWGDIARVRERTGEDAIALACWARVRTLRRELHDQAGELVAVEGLARVTRRHMADPSYAVSYYREAIALSCALGDRGAEGRLRNAIGILEWGGERYDAALEHFEIALSCFRDADDREGIGLALNSIGAAQRALGRRDEAQRALREALAHNRQGGHDTLLGHTLGALGSLEMDHGEADRAAHYFEESLDIRARVGDRRGEAWMRYELARVATTRGEADRGRDLLGAAARLAGECDDAALGEACDRLRRTAGL